MLLRWGLGVVLMQDGKPIYFLSEAPSLQNRNKLVYEKELMAILLAF